MEEKDIYGVCCICEKPFNNGDLTFKDFGNSFYYCEKCRNKQMKQVRK